LFPEKGTLSVFAQSFWKIIKGEKLFKFDFRFTRFCFFRFQFLARPFWTRNWVDCPSVDVLFVMRRKNEKIKKEEGGREGRKGGIVKQVGRWMSSSSSSKKKEKRKKEKKKKKKDVCQVRVEVLQDRDSRPNFLKHKNWNELKIHKYNQLCKFNCHEVRASHYWSKKHLCSNKQVEFEKNFEIFRFRT